MRRQPTAIVFVRLVCASVPALLPVRLAPLFALVALSLGCGNPAAVSPPETATPYDDDGGFAVDFSTDDASVSAPDPIVDDAAPPTAEELDATFADASGASESGSSDPPAPFDAAPAGACAAQLAPGDLVVDELMIASVAGTGDYGEWFEVRSTLGCAIDVLGLHGECPRGDGVSTFDIVDPLWIPPQGTFVVADSIDPVVNHGIPGTVVIWAGRHGDILRNQGTTVTLTMNAAMIDSVTYPALPATVGQSLAFPSDCDATARSDWTRWQTSTASWFPGFAGTPNGPNDDVHCP